MNKLALKYIVMLLAIVILTAGVVGGGLYWSLSTALTTRLPDVAERSLTRSLLMGDINQILFVIGPILLGGVALFSLLIFRKIAQPEYRLAQALQAMAEGNFIEPSNAGDAGELADLSRLVGQAMDKLGGMVREERQITNRLLTTAGSLLQELEKGSHDKKKLQELAQTLLDQLESLQILNTRYQIK